MENNMDATEKIEEYLRKVDYTVRRKGREILGQKSITAPQFKALQILMKNETMTIGDLSQKMDLACSTITDLIDRMESSKLVSRKRDEKDKRVVKIEVTEKGKEVLHEVLEERVQFLDSKLTSYSQEDKNRLYLELKKLYDSVRDDR